MESNALRVLLIEDNPDDLELTTLALSRTSDQKCEVETADNLADGIEMFVAQRFNVVLLDLGLPDSQGIEGLNRLRAHNSVVPIIVLTGNESDAVAADVLRHGAQDYLNKDTIAPELLDRSIRYAIRRQKLVRRLTAAKSQLERKNRRLARLYKMAHRFVDNVSHEFRTPLTVIKEYVSLMQDGVVGEVNPKQGRFLDIVSDRADDLNTMVDDMLDISKLEAGLLGLIRKDCHVAEIVDRVAPALRRKATVKGIRLDVAIDDELPLVHCDPEKIERVIINLVVNAIKFSREPGHVRLWSQRDAATGDVVIGVTDNGPGLDENSLGAIFKRFKQLDTVCRSSTKGFGLGLNIAKELVELNFGEMRVESELGSGSTFSFTVPPADPAEILRRYLSHVQRLYNGATVVSIVRLRAPAETDRHTVGDLDCFLQYLLRRTDLLFRTSANSWLFVLAARKDEASQFTKRVETALEDVNRNRPGRPLPQPILKVAGSWSAEENEFSIVDRFRSFFPAEELSYA